MPMSWRTRDAIVALGAQADGHRSRQLESADLVKADLVLAMAREHVQYVRRRYPDAAPRTGTLKRLARDLPTTTGTLAERVASLSLADVELEPWEDVEDPAGGTPEVFHACAVEIHELLTALRPVWDGVAA
jgi:protein-tyrosine-phosphatase